MITDWIMRATIIDCSYVCVYIYPIWIEFIYLFIIILYIEDLMKTKYITINTIKY